VPALPNVPNVVKVVLRGTVGPYNWVCVLHAQWTGTAPSNAALNAFGTSIEAQWAAHLALAYPSTVILTAVTLTDLTSSSGATGGWSGSTPGSASGSIVGGNAALLINYPSSFRYRGGHPRTYLPPFIAADLLDEGHWTTGLIANVTIGWGDLVNILYTATSGGCSLTGQCAVSYVSTAVTPAPPHRRPTPLVMPIAASSFSIPQELASQRRRIGRK
jgi:hypothetical protein